MEETLAVESAAGETAAAQAPELNEETLEEVLSRHRLVASSLSPCSRALPVRFPLTYVASKSTSCGSNLYGGVVNRISH
jgi:hypothetical protein